MRRTGGEGSAPPIGRADPQDGNDDINVGDKDDRATEDPYSSRTAEQ